ncbi:dihydroorotate dehydrogenase (quinone) [marine bacterium AO1-C]|nr:dihydroorotate dehydrogenase (quinone) [marine bacterium AO1-C]
MYKQLVRPILFRFDAESVHHSTFKMIKWAFKVPGVSHILKNRYAYNNPSLERELFGLTFKNPIGLAAGFDKNAVLIPEMASFGFGFIEIGTLTPKAQAGNPKPRLFRLKKDQAIINRMGFNNDGVSIAIEHLKKRPANIIVGGNIGKNKVTPNEEAISDYEKCFEQLYDYVDYFVVNVSSPNTPNLRALQDKEPLTKLLQTLHTKNQQKEKPKPILLKIAPDLTNEQLDEVIEVVIDTKTDGLIATNTTIDRGGLQASNEQVEAIGAGGLSGQPLRKRSTEVIKYIHQKSNGAFPIIGVGGIASPTDAIEKLEAGASLVQIYSGFIYEGPSLIKNIKKALIKMQSTKRPETLVASE